MVKAAAKQNCYFFCQLRYQRQAGTDHGSLSSFHFSHKSLLHWSSHKYWLWFRNALKYVLLKSAPQSWTPLEAGAGLGAVEGGTELWQLHQLLSPPRGSWGRAAQESPDLTALTAPSLHRTEVSMVSQHLAQGSALSCFMMFCQLSTWLVIFLIQGFHTIHCNGNFPCLCTSLRADPDLKAALVCPGPAKCEPQILFHRQHMPNSTAELQMENGEKRIF